LLSSLTKLMRKNKVLPDAGAVGSGEPHQRCIRQPGGRGCRPSPTHLQEGWPMPNRYVDHTVLAGHAQNKVNVPADEASRRRRQVNYLRSRLEEHISVHPSYDLVKLRAAGSTAKHTAIRRRRGEGSDADVAAYVRASSVGGIDAHESSVLEWLRDRCIEVY